MSSYWNNYNPFYSGPPTKKKPKPTKKKSKPKPKPTKPKPKKTKKQGPGVSVFGAARKRMNSKDKAY